MKPFLLEDLTFEITMNLTTSIFLLVGFLVRFIKADAVCSIPGKNNLLYCYGWLAYCCNGRCCYKQVYEVWWLWMCLIGIAIIVCTCILVACDRDTDDGIGMRRRFSSFNYFSYRPQTPRDDERTLLWKESSTTTTKPYLPSYDEVPVEPSAPSVSREPPPPYAVRETAVQPESSTSHTYIGTTAADPTLPHPH